MFTRNEMISTGSISDLCRISTDVKTGLTYVCNAYTTVRFMFMYTTITVYVHILRDIHVTFCSRDTVKNHMYDI